MMMIKCILVAKKKKKDQGLIMRSLSLSITFGLVTQLGKRKKKKKRETTERLLALKKICLKLKSN